MVAQCQEVAVRAGWKLTTLLKARSFFNQRDLVRLYKCHVLPVLEFCTPVVWHAADSVVGVLDNVQRRFLRELSLTEEEALLVYNLAPLACRRDMAALGVIHRTVLGKGPQHFKHWFFASERTGGYDTRYRRSLHSKQLYDYLQAGAYTEVFRRSLFGRVRVYNRLQQRVVDANSMRLFQKMLQENLKQSATTHQLETGNTYSGNRLRPWQTTYSAATNWRLLS